MNNSDLSASNEEKWIAYVDGRLGPEESAAFERDHSDAALEKAATARIAGALRFHLPAPTLKNPDFFNEGILREISPVPSRSPVAREERTSLWSLWRVALAGACCLLAAGAIYKVFVAGGAQPEGGYYAKVLSAKAGDEELYATVLDADGLAVVWIDGFDHLASDYVLE